MDINDFFDIISGIVAFVMSLIPLIVIVFILTRLSKVAKTQQRSTGDPNVWLQQQQAKQNQPRQVKSLKKGSSKPLFSQPVAAPKAETGGSLSETFMKDDRKNDWLARQMREEERILRRGDLMDLGASHAAACDADMLKKYHLYAEHDDSVDSGEYKY